MFLFFQCPSRFSFKLKSTTPLSSSKLGSRRPRRVDFFKSRLPTIFVRGLLNGSKQTTRRSPLDTVATHSSRPPLRSHGRGYCPTPDGTACPSSGRALRLRAEALVGVLCWAGVAHFFVNLKRPRAPTHPCTPVWRGGRDNWGQNREGQHRAQVERSRRSLKWPQECLATRMFPGRASMMGN